MEYKGYVARVEFDESANVFHGQVINLRDVITFEGGSVPELRQAFEESVDDYLDFCASRNEEPEKPFSGKFLVRIDPDLHRRAAAAAGRAGESLNVWVGRAIGHMLDQLSRGHPVNVEVRGFRTMLHRQTRIQLKDPEKLQQRLVFRSSLQGAKRVNPGWAALISLSGGEHERFND